VDDENADEVTDAHVGADADIDVDVDAAVDTDTGADTDADTWESTGWTRPDRTGVASVDAALEELARLGGLPTSEHASVYDGLHRQLQDALADLDGA
jgi:hypothetical protein